MTPLFRDLFGRKKTPKREVPAETEAESFPVRTNGLYCSIRTIEGGLIGNNVFRFYENGAVLSAVVYQRKPGDGYFPNERWFNWENNENTDGGRWKRKGDHISFSIELPRGSIIYKGEIGEDLLVLDSYSQITGAKATGREFVFYPFPEVPGWLDQTVEAER